MSRLLAVLALFAAAAGAQPVSLAIVVQGNRDTLRHADVTRAALSGLLQGARPGDEFLSVLALDEPKLLSDFTASADRIGEGLAAVRAAKSTRLYDAMEFALRRLEGAQNQRRALLVIVSGEDVASRTKPKAVAEQMSRGSVELFVISLIPRYRDDLAPTWFDLVRMARKSGGDWWEPASFRRLEETARRINLHRGEPKKPGPGPSAGSGSNSGRRREGS
jgi:hypothetical protein